MALIEGRNYSTVLIEHPATLLGPMFVQAERFTFERYGFFFLYIRLLDFFNAICNITSEMSVNNNIRQVQ